MSYNPGFKNTVSLNLAFAALVVAMLLILTLVGYFIANEYPVLLATMSVLYFVLMYLLINASTENKTTANKIISILSSVAFSVTSAIPASGLIALAWYVLKELAIALK